MKAITTTTFYALPFQQISRAVSRAFIRWQLRSIDSHLASLERSVANDRYAIRELQYDRALLALRLK